MESMNDNSCQRLSLRIWTEKWYVILKGAYYYLDEDSYEKGRKEHTSHISVNLNIRFTFFIY